MNKRLVRILGRVCFALWDINYATDQQEAEDIKFQLVVASVLAPVNRSVRAACSLKYRNKDDENG